MHSTDKPILSPIRMARDFLRPATNSDFASRWIDGEKYAADYLQRFQHGNAARGDLARVVTASSDPIVTGFLAKIEQSLTSGPIERAAAEEGAEVPAIAADWHRGATRAAEYLERLRLDVVRPGELAAHLGVRAEPFAGGFLSRVEKRLRLQLREARA